MLFEINVSMNTFGTVISENICVLTVRAFSFLLEECTNIKLCELHWTKYSPNEVTSTVLSINRLDVAKNTNPKAPHDAV